MNTVVRLDRLEAEKTYSRYYQNQDRIIARAGHGDTDGALVIAETYLAEVAEAIKVKVAERHDHGSARIARQFDIMVRHLTPEKVAIVALQGVLHCIGSTSKNFLKTVIYLGSVMESECWIAKLTHDNPRLAARITKASKERFGRVEDRQREAIKAAAAAGWKQKIWTPGLKALAGGWLLDALLQALPSVFEIEADSVAGKMVRLTNEAEAMVSKAIEDLIQRQPVFLPMQEPPVPWTAWASGGPKDQRVAYAAQVMRSRHKATGAASKASIKDGSMKPALDALNSLQAVPWRINERVLTVIEECVARGIEVKGLPRAEPLPMPPRPLSEDDGERRFWKLDCDRKRRKNRALVGERLGLKEDLETAKLFVGKPYWTPMNLDWRGRVYSMCQFHFQREDRVRALFLFDQGEPIGEDGEYWLRIHTANCGAFDKIDKRPLEERAAWCDTNWHKIRACALNPMHPPNIAWWSTADKPFLFLAACLELAAALAIGPTYVAHLPVSFDGSCSGLQHLCAMTRAPEGSLVNLTPALAPQDVYATVAERVHSRVLADTTAPIEEGKEWVQEIAKLALAFGIERGLTKRNVMTYSYSSKRYGMAAQQQTDLMNALDEEVLVGKRGDHPFGLYAQGRVDSPGVAARYLANHVYASIEEVISLPAQAMTFLQKLAKALAHEGKPLRWTTPTGLPWINRYHEPNIRRVDLWLHDRGVRVKHQLSVADGNLNDKIDKDKAAAGVAPNFVHALDAAHLALTTNACVNEGITSIATVHDSFGCLASRARRFNAIIREQFVAMYETYDVLAEVLAQAKHDLTPHNWQRLPEVLHQGTLELKGVLNADYAFA